MLYSDCQSNPTPNSDWLYFSHVKKAIREAFFTCEIQKWNCICYVIYVINYTSLVFCIQYFHEELNRKMKRNILLFRDFHFVYKI